VKNLIDLLKSISKTQENQSLKCQFLIFDDMNENVTFDQTSKQALNAMPHMIRVCNLFNIGGKPNKKATHKKICLFGGSPSIIGTIKKKNLIQKDIYIAKEMEMLKSEMT